MCPLTLRVSKTINSRQALVTTFPFKELALLLALWPGLLEGLLRRPGLGQTHALCLHGLGPTLCRALLLGELALLLVLWRGGDTG